MSKAVAARKAEQSMGKKNIAATKPKFTLACDWPKSIVTETRLLELGDEGLLASREDISWRAPGTESRPRPGNDEVVVFADHVTLVSILPNPYFSWNCFIFMVCILRIWP